jgi:hypothetical protein
VLAGERRALIPFGLDVRQGDGLVVDRLNCISHLLGKVPYEVIHYEPITPPPIKTEGYERPPLTSQHFVPDVTAALESDKHGQ